MATEWLLPYIKSTSKVHNFNSVVKVNVSFSTTVIQFWQEVWFVSNSMINWLIQSS